MPKALTPHASLPSHVGYATRRHASIPAAGSTVMYPEYMSNAGIMAKPGSDVILADGGAASPAHTSAASCATLKSVIDRDELQRSHSDQT
jgi:hypothetical protein